MTTKTHSTPLGPATTGGADAKPFGWLAGRIDAWLNWLELRAQHRRLQGLDARQMKDIGVTRADVLRELNGTYTRDY